MKTYQEFILEDKIPKIGKISKFPKIGWWLDNDPVTFYHGTHERNLEFIMKNGIVAPKEGATANWVSLALEPNTAHGYAAMSGSGGESGFRAAGSSVVNVPHNQRITFVIQIPQRDFLNKMAPERGAMQSTKGKLKDKNHYEELAVRGNMSDAEYYATTEIRYPKVVPVKFIVGYGYLRG